jgi:hypothetical protein
VFVVPYREGKLECHAVQCKQKVNKNNAVKNDCLVPAVPTGRPSESLPCLLVQQVEYTDEFDARIQIHSKANQLQHCSIYQPSGSLLEVVGNQDVASHKV